MTNALLKPRHACALILTASFATMGGALVFEHGFGLLPCKLCLLQRNPYYLAMPLALAGALVPRPGFPRLIVAALAAVFLVSAGLGAYHAGVEWGYFAGPNDCGGGAGTQPGGVGDLLRSLETVRVVSCTEAAWRFLGLSLAGWNVLISLALAAYAGLSASRGRQCV